MKNTKKIVVMLLAVVMCLAVVLGCVACKDDPGKTEKSTHDIVMWVSEIQGVSDLFASQVAKFNAQSDKYIINATVNKVPEGEAATQMIADVEEGADIYCFAQDQLSRLVQAGALQKLGNDAKAAVKSENTPNSVAAATIGEDLYCYPLTSDNGYFLYYDKSVVKESSLDSLDAILADVAAAGKLLSFNVGGSGWYNASFFFGAGCVSSWETPDGKTFTGVNDTYNSDKGMIAMKGLSALMNNKAWVDSEQVGDLQKDSAALVAGTWCVKDAKKALGDNLGATKLPKYTVDGVDYQLGSYFGCKLLGVKRSPDLERSKAVQALATFLTNKECQLERYTELGWGPSNKEALEDPAVKADPTLAALESQNAFAVQQGQIPGSWWDATKALAASALDANGDEAALQTALDAYKATIDTLADPNYKPGSDATVIGSMYGDKWVKDHPMTSAGGVWTSDYPILMKAGDEFKIRLGKTWGQDFGAGAGNYKVETDGLYWVKTNVEEKTIELVPATFTVVGTINGENKWEGDVDMAIVDNTITVKMALAANDEVKVRVDKAWALNYGDGGVNGANFKVTEAGEYNITMTFDLEALTWVASVTPATAA